jgi:hypothetical protein
MSTSDGSSDIVDHMGSDHREAHGRSRNTDVEGKRMIHALEAVALAWLMLSVALFVAMNREDAMQLSRDTIDRLWRAIGVL